MTKAYTYILECCDGSFYTGYTTDLEHRLQVHNSGKGGKYTRGRTPVKIVYFEEFSTKEEAQKREWHIKQLTRTAKLELIQAKAPTTKSI